MLEIPCLNTAQMRLILIAFGTEANAFIPQDLVTEEHTWVAVTQARNLRQYLKNALATPMRQMRSMYAKSLDHTYFRAGGETEGENFHRLTRACSTETNR